MLRFLLFFLGAAVLAATVGVETALRAEAITYYLVDYPDDQDGWTLEGFITTDGTIGTLEEDDILAWSWRASKDGVSHGYASEYPASDVLVIGNILADETTIFIPGPSNPNPGWFYFEDNYLKLRTTSRFPLLYWNSPGIKTIIWPHPLFIHKGHLIKNLLLQRQIYASLYPLFFSSFAADPFLSKK